MNFLTLEEDAIIATATATARIHDLYRPPTITHCQTIDVFRHHGTTFAVTVRGNDLEVQAVSSNPPNARLGLFVIGATSILTWGSIIALVFFF